MRGAVVVVAGVGYALAWAVAGACAQVSPASPEIGVNTFTEYAQRAPVICRNGTGEVVIWQSDKQDGRGWGVYGQRYDVRGAKSGSEFRVHSYTAGSESHPAVACAGDGRFIVTWDSDHPGTVRGVFGQIFDAQGSPIGTELQINSDVVSDSVLPAVCTSPDGTAVVAWQGYHPTDRHDIFARRVSSTGELLGSEFRVNTHVESTQSRPAVACHGDGEFVVVWDSDVQDGADFGIFAQRYDRDGMPRGFELQVSSTTLGSQQRPRVAATPGDGFVVVWESRSETLGNYGIFAQRFDDKGPQGTEFRAGAETGANNTRPNVATNARGDFVIVWSSDEDGGQISGQRYTSSGVALGSEFAVTTATESSARSPSVAGSAAGDFTVAWQRHEPASGDDGIVARRFAVCGNGRLDAGEACDDGNVRNGDCCSALCELEQGPAPQDTELFCPNIGAEALVSSLDDKPKGAPCDDGNACTEQDTCQFGVCIGGAPRNCNDSNPCTTDSCRSQVGCVNAPNSLPCDDHNICTGPDVCRGGSCRGGAVLACDDGNVCTDDRCDPSSGCVNSVNQATCDDGDSCTSGDRCADGICRAGNVTSCDDGNPCTDDLCGAAAGCTHVANSATCDDRDPCTSGDACQNGVCSGGDAATCDDGNLCTEDRCIPGTGCSNTPVDLPCDDNNACTQSDRCDGGRCRGVDAVICVAIDSCHAPGTCDPATGQCSSPPLRDGSACDDGVTCTVNDTCVAGVCTAGHTGVPFLVKDINSGDKSSAPVEIVAVGDRAFFRSDDGEHGRELWTTDGSANGTMMAADIRPGRASSAPGALVRLGDRVVFAATDADGDRELWISDGSAAGTHRIRDLSTASANPTSVVSAGELVYFVADDGTSGRELWRSDGSESGTVLVKDLRPGRCGDMPCDAGIGDLTIVGARLYFTANDGHSGRELWTSDGTAGGTTLIDIRPGEDGSQPAFLTAHRDMLFFAADDGVHGKELWRSDGSASSTAMVSDLRPGECNRRPCSASPSYLTSTGGTLFFSIAQANPAARSGDRSMQRGSAELWRTDGSTDGTQRIAAIPGSPYVRSAWHSDLVFAAGYGVQTALWRSDGTSTGTHALANKGANEPAFPISLDGRLFFSGTDQQRGTELWSSDGTADGTVFVHDINPSRRGPLGGSSSPASLTAAGGLLYFSADDGSHGRELWALCR